MAWKSFLRHIIGSLGKQGYIEKQDVERKWKHNLLVASFPVTYIIMVVLNSNFKWLYWETIGYLTFMHSFFYSVYFSSHFLVCGNSQGH